MCAPRVFITLRRPMWGNQRGLSRHLQPGVSSQGIIVKKGWELCDLPTWGRILGSRNWLNTLFPPGEEIPKFWEYGNCHRPKKFNHLPLYRPNWPPPSASGLTGPGFWASFFQGKIGSRAAKIGGSAYAVVRTAILSLFSQERKKCFLRFFGFWV